jgi:hypothetical protein
VCFCFFLECTAVKNCISWDLLVIKLKRFCTVRFCSIVKAESVPVRSSPINHTHRNGTPTSISREHIMATHFTFCYLRVPFQLSSLSLSRQALIAVSSPLGPWEHQHTSHLKQTPHLRGASNFDFYEWYCHVFIAPWLIITGSGLDDWIYWQLILQSLLIIIKYKNSESIFSRTLLPWLTRTRPILVLVLRLTPTELRCLLHPLGTDHAQKTQLFFVTCMSVGVPTWSLPSQFIGAPAAA